MISRIVGFLQSQSDFILNVASPVLWCLFFVIIMDRQSLFETWFMPILGIFAAFLANSVPIGGGIVYIPALSLLGANITLGAAFTISVMPIGNGVFGLLRWIQKDPTVIIWKSFTFTVIPSWIGSVIAMFILPKPNNAWIKFLFGWFCFLLGIVVLLAINAGGLRNVFISQPPVLEKKPIITVAELIEAQENEELARLPDAEEDPLLTRNEPKDIQVEEGGWSLVVLISFLGGLILVPNIGIGPALLTYVMLAIMGYPDQHALVTGIVTGGWVCIAPFALHIIMYNDIPWKLWIMVLPGVYYGAKVKTSRFFLFDRKIILISFSCSLRHY